MAACIALCATLLALVLPCSALAHGGSYAVLGGSVADRAEIRAALDASAFDWSLIPAVIEVHVVPGIAAFSTPGAVWLSPELLHAGMFSWAVVQDEFAHQVDFFLLDNTQRAVLNDALGTKVWCHADKSGLPHGGYGCERFTSTFVWAYWPNRQNAYGPAFGPDREVTMQPWRFRTLMSSLLDPASDGSAYNSP